MRITTLFRKITSADYVRSDFCKTNSCVGIPPIGEGDHDWTSPGQCLLDAPASMKSKYPLMELYKPALSQSNIGESTIRQFFSDTLKIPKCKWEDFVEELKYLKRGNSRDFDHIRVVYERLKRKNVFGISAEEMKYDTTIKFFSYHPPRIANPSITTKGQVSRANLWYSVLVMGTGRDSRLAAGTSRHSACGPRRPSSGARST